MRIALAQINPTVGDLEGNVARILGAVKQAAAQAPDLIVFPEMALTGYPPRDILLDASFPPAALAALDDLASQLTGFPPTLVGSLALSNSTLPNHPNLYNAAWLIRDGRPRLVAAKRLLPAYDVFHEPRWFVPGDFFPPVEIEKQHVGILICEDMWDEGYPIHPAEELKAAGAEILVCLAASPYRQGVMEQRLVHARRVLQITKSQNHQITKFPLVFVNTVGANDELIFDGRSFVTEGEMVEYLPGFEEVVRVVDVRKVETGPSEHDLRITNSQAPIAELAQALTLGIRDFARKNGMKRAVLGLSGGIDSSVAAVLATHALGAENVIGVAIPSRYTNPKSTACARELCEKLGCRFEIVELEPLHCAAETTLGDLLSGTGAENVQARLRMAVLMGFVNRFGGFLLNTSNKTELTVGYSTLYGDLAGTLCPLGDLTKPQVYALAQHVGRDVIPRFVFERPPSAELRPDQVDPFDYETFSPQMEALVQANQSNRAMRQAEHKRWQAGIVLKVSEKAFGTGRMMPVTRK
jgi:NAD+ synthase (glutamine-hydrolysing)